MDKLVLAIAALMWPLIVILVLIFFRPAVAEIIESARSRKFALKIGGQELTMEEASHGQQRLIVDLLMQVALIQKQLKMDSPDHGEKTGSNMLALSQAKTVLWVDDNPKNISYLLETLRDLGMKVDEATSTTDAMHLFSTRLYDFVISDMRRDEGSGLNPRAGLDLLKLVRGATSKIVPFILFTGDGSIRGFAKEAGTLHVTDMTSSPTRLLGILNAEMLKTSRKSALGR